MSHTDTFECRAYGKINLSLDVVGRLENGYHLVRMIMQNVGICDTLQFAKTDGGIRIRSDRGDLSCGPDNLIYRAIKLMQEEYGITGGADVYLEKRIPIAAGMAGGSADAAAAFKAMNALYDLGLSGEELRAQGVKLGADIPYCILGGTALSEGIGEILTPLSPMPACTILVAKPDISVSTKEVYEKLDSHEIEKHPDVDAMIKAIRDRKLKETTDLLGNVLEDVTEKMHPVIGQIKRQMCIDGALGSLMSGSGPTVFGIFDDRECAQKAGERLKELIPGINVSVTEPVTPDDGI